MDMGHTVFRDPRLARLYAYWLRKRGDRPAPSRSDLDPSEIKPFLPILNLIDVQDDPLAFRHRLVGTEIVDRLGRDATGRWVDTTLYGSAAPEIFNGLRAVANEVRPYWRLRRLDWHSRSWLGMEAVEFPLVDGSGKVNMILRGASYFTGADVPADARCIVFPLAA